MTSKNKSDQNFQFLTFFGQPRWLFYLFFGDIIGLVILSNMGHIWKIWEKMNNCSQLILSRTYGVFACSISWVSCSYKTRAKRSLYLKKVAKPAFVLSIYDSFHRSTALNQVIYHKRGTSKRNSNFAWKPTLRHFLATKWSQAVH